MTAYGMPGNRVASSLNLSCSARSNPHAPRRMGKEEPPATAAQFGR
jgi:hypothetical protein